MKKNIAFLFLLSAFITSQSSSQTVEEIVNKYINAIGGIEKINSIQSIRIHKSNFPYTDKPLGDKKPKFEINYITTIKKPCFYRNEETGGTKFVFFSNGKDVWATNTNGKIDKITSEKGLENIKTLVQIEGKLINFDTKGYKVELIGTEMINNKMAYKLKLSEENLGEFLYYIDCESFLLIKEIRVTDLLNDHMYDGAETYYSNFKDIDGYKIPFKIESKNEIGYTGQRIQRVELNPVIDDKIFSINEENNKPISNIDFMIFYSIENPENFKNHYKTIFSESFTSAAETSDHSAFDISVTFERREGQLFKHSLSNIKNEDDIFDSEGMLLKNSQTWSNGWSENEYYYDEFGRVTKHIEKGKYSYQGDNNVAYVEESEYNLIKGNILERTIQCYYETQKGKVDNKSSKCYYYYSNDKIIKYEKYENGKFTFKVDIQYSDKNITLTFISWNNVVTLYTYDKSFNLISSSQKYGGNNLLKNIIYNNNGTINSMSGTGGYGKYNIDYSYK